MTGKAEYAITLVCPQCGGELPSRGNARRRIPSLGGRTRLVHQACARLIDAQSSLTEPDGRLLGQRPRLTANRR